MKVLDRLRKELRSRDWNKVSSAFLKLTFYSHNLDDLEPLLDAYSRLYSNNIKVNQHLLQALEVFVKRFKIADINFDYYDRFVDILVRKIMTKPFVTFTPPHRDISVFLISSRPEKISNFIDKILDLPSSEYPFPIMHLTGLSVIFERLSDLLGIKIPSHPELFEEMKRSAESRDFYPYELFRFFGDAGKEYLLARYAIIKEQIRTAEEVDKLPYEMVEDQCIIGLSYFRDERILEIARSTNDFHLLAAYKDDIQVQLELIGMLGYGNTEKALGILAQTDITQIMNQACEKLADIAHYIGSEAYDPSMYHEDQFDRFKKFSPILINVAKVYREKAKAKLLELSRHAKAEIRGSALMALGLFGETELLKEAFKKDKSKWSRFFIAFGMILSDNKDAVEEGAAYIAKMIKPFKADSGFLRSELLPFVESTLRHAKPSSLIGILAADSTALRSLAAKLLEDVISNSNSWEDLSRIGYELRELGLSLKDKNHDEFIKVQPQIVGLLKKANARRNEIVSKDFHITLDESLRSSLRRKPPHGDSYLRPRMRFECRA